MSAGNLQATQYVMHDLGTGYAGQTQYLSVGSIYSYAIRINDKGQVIIAVSVQTFTLLYLTSQFCKHSITIVVYNSNAAIF